MPPDVEIAGGEGAAGRLEPGAQVAGRYTIAQLLRRGTIGEVYRASDSTNGHPVELYVLDDRLVADASFKSQVESNLAQVASLHHKNLAQVAGLSAADSLVFAVTEFVDGNTLGDLIARKRKTNSTFSPKGAYNVVAHLCNALSHMHRAGATHGMLHPGNVLVNKAGRVKLAELGMAAGGSWRSPQAKPYAAPELLKGGRPTPASDIYSIGAILYELVTGAPPRKGAPPPSKVSPDLSAAVDKVIIRCVAPDPSKRFGDAASLKKALQGAIDSAGRPSGQRTAPKRQSLAHQLSGEHQAQLDAAGSPSGSHAAADALSDSTEKWLISKGKLDYGPFSLAQIIQQIETNQVLPGHVVIDSETGERTPVEDHALLHDLVDKAKQRRDDQRRAQAEVQHSKVEKRRGTTLYAFIAAGVLALGAGAYFLVDKLSAADDGEEVGISGIEEGQLEAKITFMSSKDRKKRGGRRGKRRPGGGGSTFDEFDGPMDLGDVSEGGGGGSERLDDSEINPVISRNGNKLARCMRKTGSRRAHIQFVIRGNGKVSFSKVNGSTGTPLAKCMAGVMKRMSFPTFDGVRTRAEFEMSF